MQNEYLYGKCPVYTAQKVIGGKWALIIINNLYTGTKRFGELQRLIPGITQAMLTKQLRNLEQSGLINRVVYTEVPPRVEYSLTDIGLKFIPVLTALEEWGNNYIDYLHANSDKSGCVVES